MFPLMVFLFPILLFFAPAIHNIPTPNPKLISYNPKPDLQIVVYDKPNCKGNYHLFFSIHYEATNNSTILNAGSYEMAGGDLKDTEWITWGSDGSSRTFKTGAGSDFSKDNKCFNFLHQKPDWFVLHMTLDPEKRPKCTIWQESKGLGRRQAKGLGAFGCDP